MSSLWTDERHIEATGKSGDLNTGLSSAKHFGAHFTSRPQPSPTPPPDLPKIVRLSTDIKRWTKTRGLRDGADADIRNDWEHKDYSFAVGMTHRLEETWKEGVSKKKSEGWQSDGCENLPRMYEMLVLYFITAIDFLELLWRLLFSK